MGLISIIVPIYNVEKYLSKCLDTLINQSFKDLEVILVDDGSSDKSASICDDYAIKDKRIKVIHKTFGGVSEARNIGIDAAKGKYLTFLDSDDWIELSTYEKLYRLAEKERADIVQCNFVKIYEGKNNCIDKCKDNGEISTLTGKEILKNEVYGEENEKRVVVWGKLYRRELFEGVRFPVGKIHEDEFVTYKLFYKASRVINLNEVLFYYRRRNDSIMGTGFNEKSLYLLEALEEKRDFFKEKDEIQLYQITEKKLCAMNMLFYSWTVERDLDDQKEIKSKIRKSMRRNIDAFMGNIHISLIGKMAVFMIFIDNRLFNVLYNKFYVQKQNKES